MPLMKAHGKVITVFNNTATGPLFQFLKRETLYGDEYTTAELAVLSDLEPLRVRQALSTLKSKGFVSCTGTGPKAKWHLYVGPKAGPPRQRDEQPDFDPEAAAAADHTPAPFAPTFAGDTATNQPPLDWGTPDAPLDWAAAKADVQDTIDKFLENRRAEFQAHPNIPINITTHVGVTAPEGFTISVIACYPGRP